MSVNLTFPEFEKLSEKYNVIPLYKEILFDLDTPLSVFAKLKSEDRFNFLLESVEKGENVGRYSFIGSSLPVYIRTKKNYVEYYDNGRISYSYTEDPIDELKRFLAKFKPADLPDLPPFWGGLVGYLAYDVIHFYEPVPDEKPDTLNLPDLFFFLSDEIIAFDNVNNSIKIIVSAIIDGDRSLREVYDESIRKIEEIEDRLSSEVKIKRISLKEKKDVDIKRWRSNFKKEDFLKAVEKCKFYIKEGDIIQVVISQRFHKKLRTDPINVYRAVRAINPSPYLFYLDFRDIKLIGSSPEILVSVKDGKILTKPIAGTRPRGKTAEEDKKLSEELLNDEKERAEHLMLVDLARNDVGKVSKSGTVKVDRFMYIEYYSHVMHIVSDVSGQLREDLHPLDVLKSVFPVGTVSGAPKVRAMQIIEEIEPEKRGPYAGAVGYISFNGNLDTAIAIRTAVVRKDDVYIQAGAGIVADSVPEREYEETVNKAKAMMKAVELAEEED
ncbi:MAG TPA: anthranilate synthase component I [Persephonella sp.]|uniref:Anthranilate synthase component 1 n=1 Tax=Persephonella marina (strain DSM 14350 / EX-H1) TaxID=123214 RepID=C0QTQ5_PERMH|nr:MULTISPECIES: anthranilate synthase component I [Persephonella]ACO03582.1 anthranilate synthase component I [Persephonella marina EX-H1]HCB70313.1 anthranilate synthase component I [Persephonella sp.]